MKLSFVNPVIWIIAIYFGAIPFGPAFGQSLGAPAAGSLYRSRYEEVAIRTLSRQGLELRCQYRGEFEVALKNIANTLRNESISGVANVLAKPTSLLIDLVRNHETDERVMRWLGSLESSFAALRAEGAVDSREYSDSYAVFSESVEKLLAFGRSEASRCSGWLEERAFYDSMHPLLKKRDQLSNALARLGDQISECDGGTDMKNELRRERNLLRQELADVEDEAAARTQTHQGRQRKWARRVQEGEAADE